MAGGRRKARSVALQALYEIDAVGHDPEATLNHLLEEATLTGENASFAQELVRGVVRYKDKLDAHIRRFAPAWPVEQIAVIDRNILRLAIFEVLLDNRVPMKVAINEAVELAKDFGSDSSPRFVNGVLGAVSALIKNEKS
ncbi:MAG: transcription antitermination factor NusB [Dehalococcoidales bacterium]|nr:transcription antitermination factor NusB [Dehalococcoidales bacterium]